MLDDVLEVLRSGLERLLERLADAAVGLLDEALELRERRLEVASLRLELLHVRHGLVVLLLGERVHRAELLAPPHQALHAGEQRLALLVGQRLGGGLRLEPEAARQLAQVPLGVRGRVAHLLRGHLRARHGLAHALQPALELGLLLRAGLEGGGGFLARGGPGVELHLKRVAPRRDRVARALERLGGTVGVRGQGEVALGARLQRRQGSRALLALALDALGKPTLGAQVPEQLRSPHRLGPVLGRLPAPGDHPLGTAHHLLGVGRLAQRGAQRALGGLARGVRLGDRGAEALQRRARLRLVADGLLCKGDELVALGELLEQPLRAARRRLGELAGAGVEDPPRARDGDAAERVRKRADRVDDPDADEQPLSKRRDVPLGTHKLRKLLPAGHRRRGRNGRGTRTVLARCC